MKTDKYSWFPENGNCPDVFDSMEAAIQDAQNRYDNGNDPYEDGDEYTSTIIGVGAARFFYFQNALETIVDNIEDNIYVQMSDFCSGIDFESECYVSKDDKEIFKKEAISALLPIIEKYVFINPEWVCTPTHRYDLNKKQFINELNKE